MHDTIQGWVHTLESDTLFPFMRDYGRFPYFPKVYKATDGIRRKLEASDHGCGLS